MSLSVLTNSPLTKKHFQDLLQEKIKAFNPDHLYQLFPGDPLMKVLEFAVWNELSLREEFNNALKARDVSQADGEQLDVLAESYGLHRKENETDAALRTRTQERVELMSGRGTLAYYRYFAFSASESVRDVRFTVPAPGELNVIVFSDDIDDVDRVERALKSEDVRCIGDQITVQLCEFIPLKIKTRVDTHDADAVREFVTNQIDNLRGFGASLWPEKLAHMFFQAPGVQHVAIDNPTNPIILTDHQVFALPEIEIQPWQ